MERTARLDTIIGKKMSCMPQEVRVVRPDDGVPPDMQADWLIKVLSTVYTQHGITKRRDQLVSDISKGNCKVWFATENESPVGSAALVKQSDGATEIGRAVALKEGVGGLLMLMASREHLTTSDKPLVAEVRVADSFKGVPSGDATQRICLGHLGLIPHALVPAFNHGSPIRQEGFVFSSSQTLTGLDVMAVPDNKSAAKLLETTAFALSRDRFSSDIRIQMNSNHRERKGWEVVTTEPFSVAVPVKSSVADLETVLNHAEDKGPFTLAPVEAIPDNVGLIGECLQRGFVPCGIDRNPGENNHPVILMGKLRRNTLYAPIKLSCNEVTRNEANAIGLIDHALRRGIK